MEAKELLFHETKKRFEQEKMEYKAKLEQELQKKLKSEQQQMNEMNEQKMDNVYIPFVFHFNHSIASI